MARTKKIIAPEEAQATDAELKAQVEAELQKRFVERLKEAASWDGGLVKVECDVEGYEGVSVWFNTENTFEMASLFAIAGALPKLSLDDQCHLMSLFARRFEWPFSTPLPTPDNPDTYKPIFMQFRSLAQWIRGAGYTQAKDARWGNASRPSEKP